MQHCPRHAGQVAQVTVLTLLHYRHLAAGCWSVCERSVFLVSLINCHWFFLPDIINTVTMVHIKHLTISHSFRGRRISEVRNVKGIRSERGLTRDWSSRVEATAGGRGGGGHYRAVTSARAARRRAEDEPLAATRMRHSTLRARSPCPSRHTHAYRAITNTM